MASVPNGSRPDEVRDNDQAMQEGDFQVNDNPEEEPAGDGWWDLEMECPGLEGEEVGTSQAELPCHLACRASRPGHPIAAGEQRARKKRKTTADRWEEARQNAWLRQMLSSGLSSKDEDEEQHGRCAESGRWTPELYEPP